MDIQSANRPAEPDFRVLVARVPNDRAAYGDWWTGVDGRALATVIDAQVAPGVQVGVRARTGHRVERAEVLGLIVEAFAPPSQLLRGVLAPTTELPAAYLVRSLVNALARETDWPCEPIAATLSTEDVPGVVERGRRLEVATLATCALLRPVTPTRLRPTLALAVELVVDRAADGSLSRLHTRAAQDAELRNLGWAAAHARALVNVVVGARPDHSRTSLIAALLLDRDWRPAAGSLHAEAIRAYARRIARAEARRIGGYRRVWSATG